MMLPVLNSISESRYLRLDLDILESEIQMFFVPIIRYTFNLPNDWYSVKFFFNKKSLNLKSLMVEALRGFYCVHNPQRCAD
jgi:hypothetical protein